MDPVRGMTARVFFSNIDLQGTVAVRGVLFQMLVCAFLCSMLSLLLRQDILLGTLGMAATLPASLLGSSAVPVQMQLETATGNLSGVPLYWMRHVAVSN